MRHTIQMLDQLMQTARVPPVTDIRPEAVLIGDENETLIIVVTTIEERRRLQEHHSITQTPIESEIVAE